MSKGLTRAALHERMRAQGKWPIAMGHVFDERMLCYGCRRAYADHEREPGPCPQPRLALRRRVHIEGDPRPEAA